MNAKDALLGGASGAIGGAGGGLLGIGTGMLGGIIGEARDERNREKQLEQQQALNEQSAKLNYEYGEKAAQTAYQRQLDMYQRSKEDQSYKSQVQDMRDAGLSVGLMMSGGQQAGGMGQASTAPKGEGAGGLQAGQAGNAIEQQMAEQNRIAIGLQQSKLKSEIEVNESIANKNKADATKTSGVDTEESRARIKEITENIENKQVQRVGIRLQNTFDEIKNEIQAETKEDVIEQAQYLTTRMWFEIGNLEEALKNARMDNEIKRATQDEIIQQVRLATEQMVENILNTYIDTELKNANKTLTERQVKEIGQKMKLDIIKTELEAIRMEFDKIKHYDNISQEELDRLQSLMGSLIGAIGNITTGTIIAASKQHIRTETTKTGTDHYDKHGNYKGGSTTTSQKYTR